MLRVVHGAHCQSDHQVVRNVAARATLPFFFHVHACAPLSPPLPPLVPPSPKEKKKKLPAQFRQLRRQFARKNFAERKCEKMRYYFRAKRKGRGRSYGPGLDFRNSCTNWAASCTRTRARSSSSPSWLSSPSACL